MAVFHPKLQFENQVIIIAICKIWSFSFLKLVGLFLCWWVLLLGRWTWRNKTDKINDSWEMFCFYSMLFLPVVEQIVGDLWEQSRFTIICCMMSASCFFSWFELWLDSRFKTFVVCSPTDLPRDTVTKNNQHYQPYIQKRWGWGVENEMLRVPNTCLRHIMQLFTVNRNDTLSYTLCMLLHYIMRTCEYSSKCTKICIKAQNIYILKTV